ncbi:YusW family protein [Paenibacillus tarimensis]
MSLRKVTAFMLAFMLLLSWQTTGFAKKKEDSKRTEDGRIQVTMEFDDLGDAQWAAASIGKMKSKDVFQGYEDGTFRPNAPVSRVEALVTAVRLMGLEEQAIAKPAGAKLQFKDAKLIDQKFSWAKGYILVALENDLIGETEVQLKPDKPASRVWVASLLVKALDLKAEALAKMTTPLDYKDRDEIPAGSVGYINVAAEQGIVSGYPDGTFKPNNKITRAEMSALLDRTNDSMLEQDGSVRLNGVLTAVSFASSGTSVADSVYGNQDGQLTLRTFNGDSRSLTVSSELLVQQGQAFIPASQLLVDDAVSVMVKDNRVVDAVLLQKSQVSTSTAGIGALKLEIEYTDGRKVELKFKNHKGKNEAEIKQKHGKTDKKLKGAAAAAEAETILSRLNLTPEMTPQQVIEAVIRTFELEAAEIEELEAEIRFANGYKLEVKHEAGASEAESAQQEEGPAVSELKLQAEGLDNSKISIKYEWDEDSPKAEFKITQEDKSSKLNDKDAARKIQQILDQADLTEQMNEEEIVSSLLKALGMEASQLKKLELEVEFNTGVKIEYELN